jgi:hypothetical protein
MPPPTKLLLPGRCAQRLGAKQLTAANVVAGHIIPQLQKLSAAASGLQPGEPCGALLPAAPVASLVGYGAFLLHHHQLLPPALLASTRDCMLWVLEPQQEPQPQEGQAGAALVCSSVAGLHLAPWLLDGDANGNGSSAADGSTSSSAFGELCRGIIPVRAPSSSYLRHGSRQQWCAFLSGALHCGSPAFVVQRVVQEAAAEDVAALSSSSRAAGSGAPAAAAGAGQQAAQQWQVADHHSQELEAVLLQLVQAADTRRLSALLGLLDSWWPLELERCSRRRLVQGGLLLTGL